MEPQLYMWSGTRAMILGRHDFFVQQIKSRVLAQFADIQGDTDRHLASEIDRLRPIYDDGMREESDVAEAAMAQAEGFHALLSEMREDMILGALAGLYHQWEKDLRDFLEQELLHYVDRGAILKEVWRQPISNVFALLTDFGWDCVTQPFFADVDACRVIVNVHKHGKGNSLVELAEKYPEFLDEEAVGPITPREDSFLDHEWLRVTQAQFDRLAEALRAFWVIFPERLFLRAD